MRINRLSVSFFGAIDVLNPKFYGFKMLEDGWSLILGPLWLRWWPTRRIK